MWASELLTNALSVWFRSWTFLTHSLVHIHEKAKIAGKITSVNLVNWWPSDIVPQHQRHRCCQRLQWRHLASLPVEHYLEWSEITDVKTENCKRIKSCQGKLKNLEQKHFDPNNSYATYFTTDDLNIHFTAFYWIYCLVRISSFCNALGN